MLRNYLDEVPLWDRGALHVSLQHLIRYVAIYLYLPRLAGPSVLIRAISDGLARLTWAEETFAYAEGYDATNERYLGLVAGQQVALSADSGGMLVRPDVARRQIEREREQREAKPAVTVIRDPDVPDPTCGNRTDPVIAPPLPPPPPPAPTPVRRRCYGTVRLDPIRAGRDVARIAEEVMTHLVNQPGAEVTVTLEIEARLPNGASEQIVRIVTENSKTLKFTNYAFEE